MPDKLASVNSAGSMLLFSQSGQSWSAWEEHPAILPPSQPGSVGRVSRFELTRQVGAGGMGIVFEARESNRPEPVALKLLREELAHDKRMLAFFQNEARHGAKLKHPNILPVLEYHQNPALLIMPFLSGGNLKTWLKQQPSIPTPVILKMVGEIASALNYAHKKGLIHRDLKPSNVLMDHQGRVYVSDFGLALTVFNDALVDIENTPLEGTPNYMSPAVARGEAEDTRCDIYSFGALLYELLCGRVPYEGLSARQVIEAIRQGPPQPILDLNPQAPLGLARISEWAMARQLNARYAHVEFILTDLQRVREGKEPLGPHGDRPALSAPPSKATRAFDGEPVDETTPNKEKDRHALRGNRNWLWILLPLAVLLGAAIIAFRQVQKQPRLEWVHTIQNPGIPNWEALKVKPSVQGDYPRIDLATPQKVIELSHNGEVLKEWTPPPGQNTEVSVAYPSLNEEEHRYDLLVVWRQGTHLHLSVLNSMLHETRRFSAIGSFYHYADSPEPSPDSSIHRWVLIKSGLDQVPVMLVGSIATGKALKPRGLMAWNYATGEPLWFYESICSAENLESTDLDDDGIPEILFGTSASANDDAAPDGTSDRRSDVFAITAQGKFLWRTPMDTTYTQAKLLVDDLDNDGRKEIIAWLKCVYENRLDEGFQETGFIVRLNASGQVIAKYSTEKIALWSCLAVDLEGNGQKQLVATDRLGQVHVLDENLALKKIFRFDPCQYQGIDLTLHEARDINGDAKPELIFSSAQRQFIAGNNPGLPTEPSQLRAYHDCKWIITNTRLQPLTQYLITKNTPKASLHKPIICDIDLDGRVELLLAGTDVKVLRWRDR